jgi:hypothetical protein
LIGARRILQALLACPLNFLAKFLMLSHLSWSFAGAALAASSITPSIYAALQKKQVKNVAMQHKLRPSFYSANLGRSLSSVWERSGRRRILTYVSS